MVNDWIAWFDKQSPEDQRVIALNALEKLLESDDVEFGWSSRFGSCLYWVENEESLSVPF